MKKIHLIEMLIISFLLSTCNNLDHKEKISIDKKKSFTDEVDFTISNFSIDTNSMIITCASDENFEKFNFKMHKRNTGEKGKDVLEVLTTYVESKAKKNKYSYNNYLNEAKPLKFNGSAFIIGDDDWNDIKSKVRGIINSIDSAHYYSYCEFCMSCSISYNDSLIPDKLIKNKENIKSLFNFLKIKYKDEIKDN
jgi:hypothetical protein